MAVTQTANPTFSEGKRNAIAGSRVEIKIVGNDGGTRSVKTIESGGSETNFETDGAISPHPSKVFILQSRRTLDPFFNKQQQNRSQNKNASQGLSSTRQGQTNFNGRLFEINKNSDNRDKFNRVLSRVLGSDTDWTIDQTDQGAYYLKISKNEISHTSDGLGEGLLSAFFIVDALYDSEPGSMIVIDEPELSLHPQLQKKIMSLFAEYAKDRQIVISTHSSKFIDWPSIVNGACIHRVFNQTDGSDIGTLQEPTRAKIKGFLTNLNNPHTLGLEASEVFFLDDHVVLVEGQEDVVFFPKVLSDLDLDMTGELFGWGVGGADNMSIVSSILSDLGFTKVAGIVDCDRADVLPQLVAAFPTFHFVAQPADDIRFKPHTPEKSSLLEPAGVTVRPDFRQPMTELIEGVNAYLASDTGLNPIDPHTG